MRWEKNAMESKKNLVSVQHHISKGNRWKLNRHKGGVLWFTGLPGSGKSTLATELEQNLFTLGYNIYVLDGDNIRQGLNSDLGFSPPDRTENIRRIGEVAALFVDAGFIVIAAVISPYRNDRDLARKRIPNFNEVFIDADISVCEDRDPKGHYKKARNGEIPEFTGVSAPYQAPVDPELTIDTANNSIEECIQELIDFSKEAFIL